MKLFLKTALIMTSLSRLASAQHCAVQPTSTCMNDGKLLVVGMPADPRSLTGVNEVDILYANLFRYTVTVKPTTQTPIAAAKAPSQFGPGASGGTTPGAAMKPDTAGGSHTPAGKANELVATRNGQKPADKAIPVGAAACDQTNPDWPSATPDRVDRIHNCWIYLRGKIEEDRGDLLQLADDINTAIGSVADEQSCYQNKLKEFPDPSLREVDAARLVTFAEQNTCVLVVSPAWPDASGVLVDLSNLQDELNSLATAPGFPDWIKQAGYTDANAALIKQVAALITEATSYSNGAVTVGATEIVAQKYTDWKAARDGNLAWRGRLDAITGINDLNVPVSIDHCHDFYGKGHTTTVAVSATDLSSSAATPQTLTLATNTCLPASIASAGIGITFLSNPTYGFIAGDTVGGQVIGKTTINREAPVFAALYNVKLGRGQHLFGHGMEMFASPGVGFSTASSTTATDFLAGISLSFARRVLFLTPAMDFGQRTQLAPGFSIGTAKGALTSIPTATNWRTGFALIISFGAAPS